MTAIVVAWAISLVVLTALAVVLGVRVLHRGLLGILIDDRGRYSLSRFQLVLWTLVIVSLISGLFFGRLVDGANDPLGFDIPSEVLALLGISVGSGVLAQVTKSYKDTTGAAARVAASEPGDNPPFLAQMFLLEEGSYADKAVDVTKFQNFAFTIVLVVAYVALVVHMLHTTSDINGTSIPGFSGTFLTLLGISHAGYLAWKLTPQSGVPDGLTVKARNARRA